MNNEGMNYQDILRMSQETGTSFSKLYMEIKRPLIAKQAKKLPLLWKALMGKKYILPNSRQNDYYSAELCNHLIIDFLMEVAVSGVPKPVRDEPNEALNIDEVLSTQYASIVKQLECGRPVFYLEKELASPIMKTKLPDDFVIDDIQWRFPSFRVYLPKGTISIERDGYKSDVMFLDIVKIAKDEPVNLATDYKQELVKWAYGESDPSLYYQHKLLNKYDGMGVSGSLDYDGNQCAVTYAGTTPMQRTTIRRLFDKDNYTPLLTRLESDEMDNQLTNDMLKLAVNLLMFLSSPVFIDDDDNKNVIRKPKMEGDRLISGLYPAKFIGKMQLKIKDRDYVKGNPTGRTVAGHWTSGHWQRIAYGPNHSLRRLQWIGLYWSGEDK